MSVEIVRKTNKQAQKHLQELMNIKLAAAKIGWFSGNDYPSEKGKPSIPVAKVAAIQEFGAPSQNIPPRPFIRPTVKQKQKQWIAEFAQLAKGILKGTQSHGTAMEAIGGAISGDIRKAISDVKEPRLKLSTIKARLRGKAQGKSVSLTAAAPLKHTRQMIDSLSHKVEKA